MRTPELTLNAIRKNSKKRDFRASDFLTEKQQEEVRLANAKGKKEKRLFDEIDAYSAEILARFGYEVYRAWLIGDIEENKMIKWIYAERAREASARLRLESIIALSVAGANHPTKNRATPKGLKVAEKILKEEEKNAKGIF